MCPSSTSGPPPVRRNNKIPALRLGAMRQSSLPGNEQVGHDRVMTAASAWTSAPLVVFDGGCAFCTSSVDWFARTFPGGFDTVPYQRADLAALELTAEQCHARLQWVTDPDVLGVRGNHRSGAQAVAAMLRAGGRARGDVVGTAARLVGLLASHPPMSWGAAAVYAVVAANRTRLPGGTPACAL